jgi:hypothetical protein
MLHFLPATNSARQRVSKARCKAELRVNANYERPLADMVRGLRRLWGNALVESVRKRPEVKPSLFLFLSQPQITTVLSIGAGGATDMTSAPGEFAGDQQVAVGGAVPGSATLGPPLYVYVLETPDEQPPQDSLLPQGSLDAEVQPRRHVDIILSPVPAPADMVQLMAVQPEPDADGFDPAGGTVYYETTFLIAVPQTYAKSVVPSQVYHRKHPSFANSALVNALLLRPSVTVADFFTVIDQVKETDATTASAAGMPSAVTLSSAGSAPAELEPVSLWYDVAPCIWPRGVVIPPPENFAKEPKRLASAKRKQQSETDAGDDTLLLLAGNGAELGSGGDKKAKSTRRRPRPAAETADEDAAAQVGGGWGSSEYGMGMDGLDDVGMGAMDMGMGGMDDMGMLFPVASDMGNLPSSNNVAAVAAAAAALEDVEAQERLRQQQGGVDAHTGLPIMQIGNPAAAPAMPSLASLPPFDPRMLMDLGLNLNQGGDGNAPFPGLPPFNPFMLPDQQQPSFPSFPPFPLPPSANGNMAHGPVPFPFPMPPGFPMMPLPSPAQPTTATVDDRAHSNFGIPAPGSDLAPSAPAPPAGPSSTPRRSSRLTVATRENSPRPAVNAMQTAASVSEPASPPRLLRPNTAGKPGHSAPSSRLGTPSRNTSASATTSGADVKVMTENELRDALIVHFAARIGSALGSGEGNAAMPSTLRDMLQTMLTQMFRMCDGFCDSFSSFHLQTVKLLQAQAAAREGTANQVRARDSIAAEAAGTENLSAQHSQSQRLASMNTDADRGAAAGVGREFASPSAPTPGSAAMARAAATLATVGYAPVRNTPGEGSAAKVGSPSPSRERHTRSPGVDSLLVAPGPLRSPLRSSPLRTRTGSASLHGLGSEDSRLQKRRIAPIPVEPRDSPTPPGTGNGDPAGARPAAAPAPSRQGFSGVRTQHHSAPAT